MPIEERYAIVKRQKRCTNCLGTSHDLKGCKSRFVCNSCQKKHHSLLHRPASSTSSLQPHTTSQNLPYAVSPLNQGITSRSNNPPKINTTPLTHTDTTDSVLSFSTQFQSKTHQVILGTALVDVYKDDIKYTVRALIDSASAATFVSKRLQMKLNIPTLSSQAEIYGLSGSLTATAIQTCRLHKGSLIDNQFRLQTDAFIIRKLTGQLCH